MYKNTINTNNENYQKILIPHIAYYLHSPNPLLLLLLEKHIHSVVLFLFSKEEKSVDYK